MNASNPWACSETGADNQPVAIIRTDQAFVRRSSINAALRGAASPSSQRPCANERIQLHTAVGFRHPVPMPDASLFANSALCVVGAVCRDIKTAPLPIGDYVLKDGETSISSIQETIGGGGANSAGIAASLGANSRFAGVVGKDELGERLKLALERGGVRCFLHRAAGLATGYLR